MTESPTKKYRVISILTGVLSALINILPLGVYAVLGFVQGSVHQKLTLGLTLMIALILVGVNLVFKFHIRSVLWVVVLGIYFCINNIMPLLLILAIGTVLDEAIITPVHKRYAEKYRINKEIDKR